MSVGLQLYREVK
jgi:hypothetical protein